MWNYEKLSAKFLVSSIKVIDTVGFLSFFKSFTRTTIKIPLNYLKVYLEKQSLLEMIQDYLLVIISQIGHFQRHCG